MNAVLVRIGIDHEYGRWNAPVESNSGRFVYVPIPESREPIKSLVRLYDEIVPNLRSFCEDSGLPNDCRPSLPEELLGRPMHLDPDFEHLTYGDNGAARGAKLKKFVKGDLVVFYAGLRPVGAHSGLLYALVGLYLIDEIVVARDVPKHRWSENAHTRKVKIGGPDIIVRAQRSKSGRFERAVEIGEWRNGAYRVKNQLLEAWGGLSVKDGFIQRSIVPPSFRKPQKFYDWFQEQGVTLVARNN